MACKPKCSDCAKKDKQIIQMREALERIAWRVRPLGPTPKKIDGYIVETMESVAINALKGVRYG